MWLFRTKKNIKISEALKDFTDFHCHILPGVDDGVKTMEESLAILQQYESLGVQRVILTPHINNTYNDWILVEERYDQLKESYKGSIVLDLSAEYMLDSGFEAQQKRGLKTFACEHSDKCVLVETSYLNKPSNLNELLYDILTSGYTPVIAHPERYLYMNNSTYERLKDCEYLFQLNLFSLNSYYGSEVRKRALYLHKKGFYDLTGTDLHSLKSLAF